MYTSINFKTKKAFKAHVTRFLENADHFEKVQPVTLFAPSALGQPKLNGTEYVEGPHYPAPHTWYAQVEVKDGIVVKVK